MNTLEQLSENRVKLTIEVTAELWQHALDKAFEIKVKEVKVDGFRPGKLPKAQYITRFGYESLYEEAIDHVLNETYPKAIVENKVKVVNNPDIDLDVASLSPDKGFTYTAEVDVFPVVHLGDYKGLKVTPLSKEVTEEELDAEIQKLLASKGENVIKEGPAALGDTTVIDFEGFIEGVAFEGGKGENYELELGSQSFIPGFEEQLVGMVAGEEKEINVTFPENYHAEMAGKPAMFKVLVHEVKNKEFPEWNDEEVKELAIENVNTVFEHREHLRAELLKNKENAYEENLNRSLLDAFADLAHVDIPQSMLKNSANDMKKNIQAQADQYKIPFEIFLQYIGLAADTYEDQLLEVAEKRVKEDLIIDALIAQENIVVTKEELEVFYQEVATENNVELEKAKQAIKEDDANYRVQYKKSLALLKDNAVLD